MKRLYNHKGIWLFYPFIKMKRLDYPSIRRRITDFDHKNCRGQAVDKPVDSVNNLLYTLSFPLLWKPDASKTFGENLTFCRKHEGFVNEDRNCAATI